MFRTKDDPVGMVTEKTLENIAVYSISGGIEMIASQAVQINIYAIDGRLVRSVMLNEGRNSITGIAPGLYLVNRTKVIVTD